jgi:hypothetical protein
MSHDIEFFTHGIIPTSARSHTGKKKFPTDKYIKQKLKFWLTFYFSEAQIHRYY